MLYEKGRISEKTQTILNYNMSSAYKDALRPGVEFWDSGKTLKYLSESEYFIDETDRDKGLQWPSALKTVLSEGMQARSDTVTIVTTYNVSTRRGKLE